MTPVSHVAGASFDRSLACCLRRLLRSTLLHSLAQITMALTDGIVIKVSARPRRSAHRRRAARMTCYGTCCRDRQAGLALDPEPLRVHAPC